MWGRTQPALSEVEGSVPREARRRRHELQLALQDDLSRRSRFGNIPESKSPPPLCVSILSSVLYRPPKDEYVRASDSCLLLAGITGWCNMGNLERRNESRSPINLPLTVWGVDTKGERFLEEARARDISLTGALLTGLDTDLSTGDVIGILYSGKKARFRVIWIRYDGGGDKMQVAVHRLTADECPWRELLVVDEESRPERQSSAEV